MRFFRCEKCGNQFSSNMKMPEQIMCGAVVKYIPALEGGNYDDEDEVIPSLGLKPLGCGGKVKEVSLEEAMSYVSR